MRKWRKRCHRWSAFAKEKMATASGYNAWESGSIAGPCREIKSLLWCWPRTFVIIQWKLFSKNSTVITQEGLVTACIHCKYQRKLILNQLSRKRLPKVTMAKTNIRRSHRRMKAKFTEVKMTLSQMKANNARVPKEMLFEKIQGLPQKQQVSVKTCFEAACGNRKRNEVWRGMALRMHIDVYAEPQALWTIKAPKHLNFAWPHLPQQSSAAF